MPVSRLFIAIFPPPEAAQALLRGLDALSLPSHRRVPAEQIHLTLRFLGDTPAEQLAPIEKLIRSAAAATRRFTLRPERLVGLPARRPRVVAAATDAPEPLRSLEAALRTRHPTPPADPGAERSFIPHLTLARYRRSATPLRTDRPIDAGGFLVTKITLISSELRPEGPRYTALIEADLGAEKPPQEA
jgi:RNA 2',3'-cyclic 3'-phosphodiesterase